MTTTDHTGRVKITGLEGLQALLNKPMGRSKGFEFTQERVIDFADISGDHQEIHINPDFAKSQGLEGTIVHGKYLSAVVPPEIQTLIDFVIGPDGLSMVINLGGSVQYRGMVLTGSMLYIEPTLSNIEEKMGGVVITIDYVGVADDNDKPVVIGQEQYLCLFS